MAIDSYGYYAFLPSLSLPASTPIQSSPRFLAYLSNPKPPPIYPKASCCLFLVESYFHPSAILPSPFLYRGCMVRNLASVYSIYTVEYPNTLIIQHGIIWPSEATRYNWVCLDQSRRKKKEEREEREESPSAISEDSIPNILFLFYHVLTTCFQWLVFWVKFTSMMHQAFIFMDDFDRESVIINVAGHVMLPNFNFILLQMEL